MYNFRKQNEQVFQEVENYRALGFEDYKYSYFIIKPNGVNCFKEYVEELKRQGFTIVNFFAVQDYDTVNIALHPTQKELRHIIPINNMFKEFYSNYAVLILVAKSNITYNDFAKQVYIFKKTVRKRFEPDYISYVFDASELLNEERQQLLKIIDKDSNEVPKKWMNQKGSFLVFSVNSLHSPDADVEVTISEMQKLEKMGIFSRENIIPKALVEAMMRYETFAFIKDM